MMTAKERLLFYWQAEVEERFKKWKDCDESEKQEAKREYLLARRTLEEVETMK